MFDTQDSIFFGVFQMEEHGGWFTVPGAGLLCQGHALKLGALFILSVLMSSASPIPSVSPIPSASPRSLTHLDATGNAHMVDVSHKPTSARHAIATGYLQMSLETLNAIQTGNAPKGDVLGTARLAGIMAAKQTATLIPLCHPLPLKKIGVQITPDETLPGYRIEAEVKTTSETGVEMEALTAVSVAALTLYDMAKALEKSMQIGGIHLVSKTGGKSGDYQHSSPLSTQEP